LEPAASEWRAGALGLTRISACGKGNFAEANVNATRGKSKAFYQIGILSPTNADGLKDSWSEFKSSLERLGYSEGKDIAFVSRFANGEFKRLPALASELVQAGVDVIVAATPPAVLAAKSATNIIPIVFPVGSDPVETGLVSSFERPGGNVTGVATMSWQLSRARLALLKELIPAGQRVALLRHSANPALELQVRESQAAAKDFGIELRVSEYSGPQDLEPGFRAAKDEGASALLALSDPVTGANAQRIATLSFEYLIPIISPGRAIVEAGGVLAYGPNISLLFRRAASLVDRILKGATVGDLAIEQPADFELIINMKSADVFRLTVPQALLSRATEVIR
jgi:putative tryptophan/tyrosine transport system substrate-binding protein